MIETLFSLLFLVGSFFVDLQVLQALEGLRMPVFTFLFHVFTGLGTFIAVPALLLSVYFWKKKKPLLAPLWGALLGSLAVSYMIKIIVQRARPLAFAIIEEAGYSFPSSHAAVAFALVPLLCEEFPDWKMLWYFLAFMVALSRVYLGVHYLSDVIAGALLGVGMGKLFLLEKVRNILKR